MRDLPKILSLQNFENVRGNPCFVMVLPQPLEQKNFINSEADLKKALGQLLRGHPRGKYGFIVINVAPIAYGKCKKIR